MGEIGKSENPRLGKTRPQRKGVEKYRGTRRWVTYDVLEFEYKFYITPADIERVSIRGKGLLGIR